MKQHRIALAARILALTAAMAVGLTLGITTAMSQEDMKQLQPKELAPHSRPAAVFVHDTHNEKAGIEDCETCHHGQTESGAMDPGDNTAGTPCVECHAINASKGTPLKRAYHRQCISCHTEKQLGPTYCGGCHKG